jgi:two-component system, sensor histidine kinase
MPIEPIEKRLLGLESRKVPSLNQEQLAIALFDSKQQLVSFNPRFAQLWELSKEWLAQQPSRELVFFQVMSQGFWDREQYQKIQQALEGAEEETVSFCLQQSNGICLEVHIREMFDGGQLYHFWDVTKDCLSDDNSDAEVRRLKFLLELMERLQPTSDLREIGQFALSYLVQAMGAAFGDVKVIGGTGEARFAGMLTNEISGQFIATYGEPAIAEMQALLGQKIPFGQGLLWEVVKTGQPLFVEDYCHHPQALPRFRHPAIGQLGIFPIPSADGRIIGVLTLECRVLKPLQQAPQQDMLMAACRMLGVAIERAQAQDHLRQMNEDLERASQLKSEFLASMSHELRTPLNSILGFSDLLIRQIGGNLSDRQVNYVQIIEKSGQHLLQLINDILDLSKIEAGKVELEIVPVSLQHLCSECLKMIQPRADKKRLGLSFELDYRLQQVMLDERRVCQIVVNLLSNAVKFTPEGGYIKLSSRMAYGSALANEYRPDRSPINASTPYLCLEVKDSGIGIPKDKWHLLFRSFQQVDASLTRSHEGTGLGLALTKRLAELHGGTVSLESEENLGSTFRVWLPLTEMRQNISASSPAGLHSTGQSILGNGNSGDRWILVVEDQPFNQELICSVLELEGYKLQVIDNGHAMLEMMRNLPDTSRVLPDLILMDIQLPGVDGLELIRQLKANSIWQKIPTIAVTAMAMAGDRDRTLAVGADAYLSKPLHIDQLLDTVRSFVDGTRQKPVEYPN